MLMRWAAAVSLIFLLIGCASGPDEPSLSIRTIDRSAGEDIRIRFSTDHLAQGEAQELLLLIAAITVRKAGSERFQFRSVDAEGLLDSFARAVRYFDVDARVMALQDGDEGDPARKTYETAAVIDYFRPRYAPILPPELQGEGAARPAAAG